MGAKLHTCRTKNSYGLFISAWGLWVCKHSAFLIGIAFLNINFSVLVGSKASNFCHSFIFSRTLPLTMDNLFIVKAI